MEAEDFEYCSVDSDEELADDDCVGESQENSAQPPRLNLVLGASWAYITVSSSSLILSVLAG